MKRVLLMVLFALFASCGPSTESPGTADSGAATNVGDGAEMGGADIGGGNEDMQIASDVADPTDVGPVDTSPLSAMDRPASVFIPDDYEGSTAYPLIILLHGYGVTGRAQDFYFGLSNLRTERGFIVTTPNGTLDTTQNRFWNATSWCCGLTTQKFDDVAYISGLIAEAKVRFNVDPQRVYLIGHSNGGFMSYRMACEVDGIAGIASLAGSGWVDEADCTGTGGTVSVLEIHGDADTTIKYDGSVGEYPSAPEMMRRWAARDGCDPDPTAGPNLDIVSNIPGDETTVETWSGCDDDTAVELWTIEGGGHIPSLQTAFAGYVLDFLFAHTSP